MLNSQLGCFLCLPPLPLLPRHQLCSCLLPLSFLHFLDILSFLFLELRSNQIFIRLETIYTKPRFSSRTVVRLYHTATVVQTLPSSLSPGHISSLRSVSLPLIWTRRKASPGVSAGLFLWSPSFFLYHLKHMACHCKFTVCRILWLSEKHIKMNYFCRLLN